MNRKKSTDEFFNDTSQPIDNHVKISPFTIWTQTDIHLLSLYQLHNEWVNDSEKGPRVHHIIRFYLRFRLFHNVLCFAIALLYFIFNCGSPTSYNVVISGLASMIIFYGLWVVTKAILLYVPSVVFGKMKFDGTQSLAITLLLSFGGAEEIQGYHLV